MERQAEISNKGTLFEDVISVPSDEAAGETCDSGTPVEKKDADEGNPLESFNLIEPPPLDWRSDSSSGACSLKDFEESGSMDPLSGEISEVYICQSAGLTPTEVEDLTMNDSIITDAPGKSPLQTADKSEREVRHHDLDHSHIHTLLNQLQLFHPTTTHEEPDPKREPEERTFDADFASQSQASPSMVHEIGAHPSSSERNNTAGLLFTESHQRDLLQLLEDPEPDESQSQENPQTSERHIGDISELTDCQTRYVRQTGEADEMISVSYGPDIWHNHFQDEFLLSGFSEEEMMERWQQSEGMSSDESRSHSANVDAESGTQSTYKDVPGPCDPEDLLDGIIFGAKYLGSTQLQSDRNPSTNARMSQAQEAVDRIKAPEGESQPMAEVDLFISTQRIKVLSADTQEAMMDHSLQVISYIADIGSLVVLMVRRKPVGRKNTDSEASSSSAPKKCWMICHVFSSEDAHIIAQAIGQAFGVAYQQFLHVNGIKANELGAGEYCLGTEEQYNGDLVHFSRSENIKELRISKQVGEILGVAIVESGWGSILPTVVVANLLHGGAAERSGELSIGDRIMSVNGASLVGLPIATCQDIIRDLKNFSLVKLSVVRCPPVTMAIIKRPNPKYQLGFSVEDGIICSLMRGGIAERGGIRVGHRIIEINGQSVVATPHEKIIDILTNAVGEIHLKTMPVSTYRLLTGQDQPVYL